MAHLSARVGDSVKTSMQKQFHSKLLILKLPRMAPGFITYDIENGQAAIIRPGDPGLNVARPT
jgi:hypothetical protein